jgi:hypothetical protein
MGTPLTGRKFDLLIEDDMEPPVKHPWNLAKKKLLRKLYQEYVFRNNIPKPPTITMRVKV